MKIRKLLNTPLGIMVVVALVVLSAEFLFMVLLHEALIPMLPFKLPQTAWDVIDAVTLTAFISPVLYLLVFRRIQQSEAYLRQINAAIQDAIIVIDGQGRITEWNPAAQKIFQYSREEVLGKLLHQLIMPQCFISEAERSFLSFNKNGEGKLVGNTTEIAAKRKDGQEFLSELSISAFKVKDAWHAIGVMRDITERKRIEAELIAARELAEENNRAKNLFLARMGHELLTPLNSIIGFAQVIEAGADDETIGKHRDNFKTIIRSGWGLHRVIRDILGLAEIETRKVALYSENVDVCGCIKDCVELILPLAMEHGVELHRYESGIEGVLVMADPFRLHEVLTDLLDNAIKYNHKGGSVTISGQRMLERVRITVSDTGQGIMDDELSTIFQPFSRLAQRSYNIEGAGVGLASAKQLIELMGGVIGVESVYGQGSTFWIELPIVELSYG